MAEQIIGKRVLSGRTLTVVILAGVFAALNFFELIAIFSSGVAPFGGDLLPDVTTALVLVTPVAYAAIIVFILKSKPKTAALFLIPTAVGDLLYTGWLLSIGTSPLHALSLVSLSGFDPNWWAYSILQAFELLVLVGLALLLLVTPKTSSISSSPAEGAPMTKSSFCPKCGSPAGEGDFCSKCGNSLSGQIPSAVSWQPVTGSSTSATAVVAFVLSFFVPIVGLVLGYISRNEIDRSQGRLTGRGLATAAIVINWISIVLLVVWVIAAGVLALQYSNY